MESTNTNLMVPQGLFETIDFLIQVKSSLEWSTLNTNESSQDLVNQNQIYPEISGKAQACSHHTLLGLKDANNHVLPE